MRLFLIKEEENYFIQGLTEYYELQLINLLGILKGTPNALIFSLQVQNMVNSFRYPYFS